MICVTAYMRRNTNKIIPITLAPLIMDDDESDMNILTIFMSEKK